MGWLLVFSVLAVLGTFVYRTHAAISGSRREAAVAVVVFAGVFLLGVLLGG